MVEDNLGFVYAQDSEFRTERLGLPEVLQRPDPHPMQPLAGGLDRDGTPDATGQPMLQALGVGPLGEGAYLEVESSRLGLPRTWFDRSGHQPKGRQGGFGNDVGA